MQTTAAPRGLGTVLRRDPAAPWRHLDGPLLGAALAIASLSCLMVFSATRTSMAEAGLDPYTYLKRQISFLGVGVVVMGLVVAIDYRNYRDLAPVAYIASVALLALVLTPLGTEVNGAQSWFSLGSFQLQPAELSKLATIVMLAAVCSTSRGLLTRQRFVVCAAATGVPAALVLLQPDMGSMLVLVAIFLGVVVVAGARPRHLAALAVVGVLGVWAMFHFEKVDDYQRDRLTDFARSGDAATTSSGFQAEQAETAIGAGGLFGAGLYEGTQTKLGFVPEQQTDFIFTVVGEELGFAGSATLLVLYGVLIWRIWRTARLAKDAFGTLVCAGVLAMLLFQVFENMGMSMGIMPITGLPLPLLSYGGSSMITTFAALGLVLNVHMRRFS
ncbi:MAG: rod shape-determining protein RodA [Actinomycetota bacterium]|jgi:rod shape determining protein RodA|nr:rod shape-determining protein RodA [Actinomycetota bacterium]